MLLACSHLINCSEDTNAVLTISPTSQGNWEDEIDMQKASERVRYGKILSGLRQQNPNTYSSAKGNVWIVLKYWFYNLTAENVCDTFTNLQTYFIFRPVYHRTGLWFDRRGDTLRKASEYDRRTRETAIPSRFRGVWVKSIHLTGIQYSLNHIRAVEYPL